MGKERLLSLLSEKLKQWKEQQSVEIGVPCAQKVTEDSKIQDVWTLPLMHLSQIELTQQKCFISMKHTLGNVMMQSQTDHCLNDLVLCVTLF